MVWSRDISASYEGREGPACVFHPCGLRTSWGRCRLTGQVWRVSTDTWMLYTFLLSGAQTDTCDNEGKCPLDYATLEHHVIVQFLLKALKCSVEKYLFGNQKIVLKLLVVLFLGLMHLLCKQSVCDLFLNERVICNPYALEHDEEKRLKAHKKYPNGDFGHPPSWQSLTRSLKTRFCIKLWISPCLDEERPIMSLWFSAVH